MNTSARGWPTFICVFDRHRGWRHAKVTHTKKAADFAELMRELVDVHYPAAECIRVVLDNLNTHQPASLYRAFSSAGSAAVIAQNWRFITRPSMPVG